MGEMAEYYADYSPYAEPDATAEFDGVEVIRTTEKEFLCLIGGEDHWIPRSQVLGAYLESDGLLVIPEWLAKKKGLAAKPGKREPELFFGDDGLPAFGFEP